MKRFGLALVLAGLLAAAAAPAALGCTTRFAVYDKETTVAVVSPGVTTQNGSVISVRRMVQTSADASTSAFVTGTSTAVVNLDLDLATGNGKIWGAEVKRPTAYPHGSWQCHFSGTFVSGTWTGKGSCDGIGSLRGWRYTADLAQVDPFVVATGHVFRAGNW
ncbi:MAG: hypothetical protein ABSA21_12120 [Candidatus Limnocylindrales bacterium]